MGSRHETITYHKDVIACFTILMLSVIIYSHGIHSELSYDDRLIYRNPDVSGRNRDFLSIFFHDFWGLSLWHQNSHKSHRPLTIWVLRATYTMFNGSKSGMHAANIVAHGLVSILVYVCTRLLDPNPRHLLRAFFAAALFVSHPVHVDAVQQIAGTAELLCAIFVLAAFSASLVKYFQIISGPLCVLAMLCKEQGIMAVPLIITFSIYRNRFNIFKVVRTQISTLSCGILLVISKIVLLNGKPPEYGRLQNPASHSNSTFVKVLSHHQSAAQHFGLLIFPYSLCFDYTYGSVPLVTSLSDLRNFSVVLMYATLFYLAYRLLMFKHLPFEAASVLLILIPFIPSSNILFPVGFILAERVLYTPSVGFCIGLSYVMFRWFHGKRRGIALLITIVALYVLRSVEHVLDFRTEESLYIAGIRAHPNSPNMRCGLGLVYFRDRYENSEKEANRRRVAEMNFKESIRLLPDHAESLTNLAILHTERGEYHEAESFIRRALKSEPHILHRLENLAVVLIYQERYCEAWDLLENADGTFAAPYQMDESGAVIDKNSEEFENDDVKLKLKRLLLEMGLVC